MKALETNWDLTPPWSWDGETGKGTEVFPDVEGVANKDREGYVYFMIRADDQTDYDSGKLVRVKIGRTVAPDTRISSWAEECQYVRLDHIKSGDHWQVEENLHVHFHCSRLEGEYFMLSKDDVEGVVLTELATRLCYEHTESLKEYMQGYESQL